MLKGWTLTTLAPQRLLTSWDPRFLSRKMGPDTLFTLVFRSLFCIESEFWAFCL